METKKWLLKKSLLSREKTINEIKDKTLFDTKIVDEVFINNSRLKRLRLSLNYKSCKVKTCSMCPFPNEGANFDVSDDELLNQIKNGLKNEKNIDLLTLYHNGNFFADNEISPKLRQKIYKLINELNIKYFVVESLPQTITENKLTEFNMYCPKITLQVAIGVQTMNEFLREYSIISPFKQIELDNAISLLKKFNYQPRVFLMFGMPFVSNDEAFSVIVKDIKEIKSRYNLEEEVVICPLVSMRGTLAKEISDLKINKDPSIDEISELIDYLVLTGMKNKISYNSSVYEYENEAIKKQKYTILKEKIYCFNKNMLLREDVINTNRKTADLLDLKENVMLRIKEFLKVKK